MALINRRQFGATLSAAVAASITEAAPSSPRFQKGICAGIFPKGMPLSECFLQARNAGFEGVELPVGGEIKVDTPIDDVKRIGDAARKAGITIVSLWVSSPIENAPLNAPDPAVRAQGVQIVTKCLELANAVGAGAMLLIPGGLGYGPKMKVGYMDTWERVTPEIRKLLPAAAKNKCIVTPENVWNKFLVSPRDMRDFVDQFKSPWLGTHFDVGNVMQFGFPQDWILTLGARIKRVHFKDYKLGPKQFTRGLMDGDVDWKEVMAALVKVNYRGFVAPELGYDANDPDQLKKVSGTVDKILALA
jgi:L-ribulose-5-phosphate 3-epimerase